MRIGHGFHVVLLSSALALIGNTGCGGKKQADSSGSGSAGAMTGSDTGSAMAGSGSGSGSAMAGSAAAGSGSGSDTGSAAGSAGSGSDAGSAAAGSGSGSGSGSGEQGAAPAMAHKAGMCPSTVIGSTTKDELKDGKVLVTITADDKDAIAAIQKRTDELLKEKADNMGANGHTSNEHDQKGAHGGGIGLCPVHVPEGATATAKHEAKGVVVTIAVKDKKDAQALKDDVDGRITKAADWVKANVKEGDKGTTGGVGGGSGNHGSNHSGKGNGQGKGDGTGGGGGKGTGGGSAAKK